MITHFLGAEEVNGYAHDLAERLASTEFPPTWFALGLSGQKMAQAVGIHLPTELQDKLRLVRVACKRDDASISFIDSLDGLDLKAQPVLLLDSAIHSGKSMLVVAEKLLQIGVGDLITYALVLKRGSCFIPNYFGVLIDDTDRSYFQLEAIPNNRLIAKKKPFGFLRTIRQDDYVRPPIETDVPSITAVTFGDLIYEATAKDALVYLYMHKNEACGYIDFEIRDRKVLINLVVSSKTYASQGVGTALIRWAETCGRSARCEMVELWAIQDRVPFYKHIKFETVSGTPPIIVSDKEQYVFMRRRILYNTKID
ncbi:MAG TPA: GNAT family N-acetyltransferase [Stellaceae bacterium]|nr:GNAT family N-acetyltransferase [Stellaceae bacterium]